MLNCERNSPDIEKRIRRSALAARLATRRTLSTFFEHGQWWIENIRTGAQWSVCDSEGAEGIHTFNGFSFEQVTQGDDNA